MKNEKFLLKLIVLHQYAVVRHNIGIFTNISYSLVAYGNGYGNLWKFTECLLLNVIRLKNC